VADGANTVVIDHIRLFVPRLTFALTDDLTLFCLL